MKFIQLIPFTLFLFMFGCDDQDPNITSCGDLSSYPTEFDITDLSIEILVTPEPKVYPTMIFGEIYNENTEVKFNGIVFSINSETQIIAKKSEKPKSLSFSLISSAYACSPVLPSTNEKIVGIKITSSAAFDGSLATGDSLKSKFDVIYADSETDFYSYENDAVVYYSLNSYLEQDDVYAGNAIQLILNEAPEFVGKHIFFIEFTLNTGEIFTLETPEISFAKL